MYYRKQQVGAFTDYITLMTRSKKVLDKMFKKQDTNANQFGLYINQYKTKYFELGTKVAKPEKIKFKIYENKDYTFEKVDQFEYLDMKTSNKVKRYTEI